MYIYILEENVILTEKIIGFVIGEKWLRHEM